MLEEDMSLRTTVRRYVEVLTPKEVRRLLEGWPNSVDFVDEIFHADDAVFAEAILNESVVGKGDTLLVDLAVTALVNQLSNGLEVRVAVCNVWFDSSKHFRRSFREANEDTAIDLVDLAPVIVSWSISRRILTYLKET